jgi:hypothetical protein
MSDAIRPILEQAMTLSDADRLEIAHLLLDSLPEVDVDKSFDDPAFLAELDRRLEDDSNDVDIEQLRAMRKHQ